ncbi:signal peptidase I [Amnibacterium endophyticum]|uniref:Signal peptidase I n=1 Tax=Amnibacterium endophyticum TaxID=2109337 RepID=A0ABW4LCR8_9MICO
MLDAGLVLVAAIGAAVLLARLVGVVLGLDLVVFATGSMTPAFPQGAVAVAQRVPLDGIRVGDVVTVDRPGRLPITHRVVDVRVSGDRAELRLRGDANRVADPVPYVVGHVSRVVLPLPPVLWMLRLVNSPLVAGTAAVLAGGAVLWALWPRRRTVVAPVPA